MILLTIHSTIITPIKLSTKIIANTPSHSLLAKPRKPYDTTKAFLLFQAITLHIAEWTETTKIFNVKIIANDLYKIFLDTVCEKIENLTEENS